MEDGLEGYTLNGLIDQGLLPIPPLLTEEGWRIWRRDHGCRPTVPSAASGLRRAFLRREDRLYRCLMNIIHGDRWEQQLEERMDEGFDIMLNGYSWQSCVTRGEARESASAEMLGTPYGVPGGGSCWDPRRV